MGVDVFLGVSVLGVFILEMVCFMVKDFIVFVMVNFILEIQLELVVEEVVVMVIGWSDYLN